MLVDGAAIANRFAELIHDGGRVVGDTYRLPRKYGGLPSVVHDAVLGATEKSFLVPKDLLETGDGRALMERGVELLGYVDNSGGPRASVNHAKVVDFADATAVGTASVSDSIATRVEAAFLVRDAERRGILQRLSASGRGMNTTERLSAVVDAARAGIVTNEQSVGARFIDLELDGLLTGAHSRLGIVTKELRDDARAASLVAAARDGVDVGIHVRDIDPSVERTLRAGGVQVVRTPGSRSRAVKDLDDLARTRMHGTSVIADVRMSDGTVQTRSYVGSYYPWNPTADGYPRARDVGIVLQGSDAERVHAMFEQGASRSITRGLRTTARELLSRPDGAHIALDRVLRPILRRDPVSIGQ